jgi:hypothetical protein
MARRHNLAFGFCLVFVSLAPPLLALIDELHVPSNISNRSDMALCLICLRVGSVAAANVFFRVRTRSSRVYRNTRSNSTTLSGSSSPVKVF